MSTTERANPFAEQLEQTAEANNFPSRQAQPTATPTGVPRLQRRYKTGRNQQINIKATPQVIDRFYKLADATAVPLGELLRQALEALEKSRAPPREFKREQIQAWIVHDEAGMSSLQGSGIKPSDALRIHRAELRQLVAHYGLLSPRIFGSVVTNSDTEGSDLDLLVDSAPGTTLLTLGGLQVDAEKLLGVKVDVLTPGFLSPKFRDKVLQQAEPL